MLCMLHQVHMVDATVQYEHDWCHCRQDARTCRKLCQETVGCNAWLFCWHKGGCDDGVTLDRRRYPFQGCELLSLQHVSLLSCTIWEFDAVTCSSP